MHFTVTDHREPNPRDAVGLVGTLRHLIDVQQGWLTDVTLEPSVQDHKRRQVNQLRRNLRYVQACKREQAVGNPSHPRTTTP